MDPRADIIKTAFIVILFILFTQAPGRIARGDILWIFYECVTLFRRRRLAAHQEIGGNPV